MNKTNTGRILNVFWLTGIFGQRFLYRGPKVGNEGSFIIHEIPPEILKDNSIHI